MVNWIKPILNFITFNEPTKMDEAFILKEYDKESDKESFDMSSPGAKDKKKSELKKPTPIEDFNKETSNDSADLEKVSKSLDQNLAFLKEKYSIGINTDIKIRNFDITLQEKVYKAFIIFIDGITDKTLINNSILQPLMIFTSFEKSPNNLDIIEYIERSLCTQNQLAKSDNYQEILMNINIGACVLFVEGANQALLFDVKTWEHRAVSRPNTEITLRGPQESFSETLRVNTALVRKILRNENLIVESTTIGQRSRTPCSVIYLKDLANPNLVNEVKRRLDSLKIDYAGDSGIIEQLIEDRNFLPSPQIISTERPDRVASMLSEGRVAIIVDGNPFALVVPITFFNLFHSAEDIYIRFPYVNFIRFIRAIAIIASLLLPGLYLAITNFHQEMIPTDLLLAISGARERVPFPSVVEIIIMEISFELIREAGIRMPGTIGPTLGIIGALILGQAAVAANIVSPILIIIVAVTGIGSLAIPSYSESLAFRINRFVYILLGAIAGLLGITLALFLHGLLLASTKSFGVPFLAPFAPRTSNVLDDTITKAPIWMEENRPDYINPLDITRQPKISKGWISRKNKGDK